MVGIQIVLQIAAGFRGSYFSMVLALDRRFGLAGAAAVVMLALDRRFVLLALVPYWC